MVPLKDKMDDDKFCMPPLHGLAPKTLYLTALRAVRSTAVESFISMSDEEKRIHCVLSANNNYRGSHNLQEQSPMQNGDNYQHQTGNIHPSSFQTIPPGPPHGAMYCHFQSQVEAMLSRYNRTAPVYNPYNLPFRVVADGKYDPYNPDDPSFLSNFPSGSRGCFKCGEIGHWTRDTLPMSNVNDRKVIDAFYKELRIHCPAFKSKGKTRFVSITLCYVPLWLFYISLCGCSMSGLSAVCLIGCLPSRLFASMAICLYGCLPLWLFASMTFVLYGCLP